MKTCKVCGETNQENFYATVTNLCKKCHNSRYKVTKKKKQFVCSMCGTTENKARKRKLCVDCLKIYNKTFKTKARNPEKAILMDAEMRLKKLEVENQQLKEKLKEK